MDFCLFKKSLLSNYNMAEFTKVWGGDNEHSVLIEFSC